MKEKWKTLAKIIVGTITFVLTLLMFIFGGWSVVWSNIWALIYPEVWEQINTQNTKLTNDNISLGEKVIDQQGQIKAYKDALEKFSQTDLGRAIGERDALKQNLSNAQTQLEKWQSKCDGLQEDKTGLTARVSKLETKLKNEQQLRSKKERLLKKFTDRTSTISIKVLNSGATVFLDGQNMETNQLDRHSVCPLNHRIRVRYDYRESYSPFYKEYYEDINSERTKHWPEDQKPKIIELERKEAIIKIFARKWENGRWVVPPRVEVIIQPLAPLRSRDGATMVPSVTTEISGGDILSVPLPAGEYRVKGMLDGKEVSVDKMVVSDIGTAILHF